MRSNYKKQVTDALKVIIKDPKISCFLKQNDPKALEQVIKALQSIEPKTTRQMLIEEMLNNIENCWDTNGLIDYVQASVLQKFNKMKSNDLINEYMSWFI